MAVLLKNLRETLPLLLLVAAGILLFEVLYVKAIGDYSSDILELWERRPALKNFIQVLVGAQFNIDVSPTGIITLGFAHPLLFALTWIFLITVASRVIASEIDRGTADLLMTLPVSRISLYVGATLVACVGAAVLSAMPLLGVALGERYFPLKEPLKLHLLVAPAANLFALNLAIFCGALLVSALASRRPPAIGVPAAALLLSFLLNFLGTFWAPAKQVAFLGILQYYRPLALVQEQAWAQRDMMVLLSAAIIAWTLGLWRFMTRDVPAA